MTTFTFTYPKTEGVSDVLLVGSFDNWTNKLPLVLTPSNGFELTVPLPSTATSVEFKFVLNGEDWVTSEGYPTATDESGNVNNVVDVVAVATAAATSSTAKIPESGAIPTPVVVATSAEKDKPVEPVEPESSEDVKYVKKVHRKVEKTSLKSKLKNFFS